ncbi:MAG: acyl-CoA/acyl-ACP dehydrogenase [Dehalococcoidia bacterium]|nr:acyl-CoA/acyl-ACP dehydrogenase [Dehalococcoidia bacterium]
MDLAFSEAQEILRKMARDFLSTECPKTMVRELQDSEEGYSPELWKKMAELGWMGLIVPEEYEGMGYGFQDLTVLLEETGRNILPGPLVPTVTSTFPILDAGSEEQKKQFLPKIAAGELILTTALLEAEGTLSASTIAAKATQKGDDFVINGTKLFVEMAHVADYLICASRTKDGTSPEEGITLFIIDAKSPGIASEVIPTIALDKLCEVRFKDVLVPKKNVLGELDKGWPIIQKMLEKGALAKCAESIGGMQAAVEMTLAYSKERVQYGRPIGAFQALQHMIADMWSSMETSRYLVYEAAWMESEGLPCAKEVSMAKAYVNEAYKYVTKWAIRLHGGIGTSRDHDIPLYYHKAKAADIAFGDTDFHRELVAQKIGLL